MQSTTSDAPATLVGSLEDPPSDAAIRIVYQAVRTLVPDAGTVALADLLAVTRLDPGPAAAAMDYLGRDGPLSIHRLAGNEPTWLVRRTDR
jgi:hypothetical protein